MSTFASFLRVPFWLEKAWQDTRVQLRDDQAPDFDLLEADTVPMPLADVRPARD
jgi:hypothetical protein